MDAEVVERLLARLRQLVVNELDEQERVVLAALLAPGVAAAYRATEVTGFGTTDLPPLSHVLAEALERAGIRVVGIEGPET